MHQTLAALKQGLEQLISQVQSSIPNDEPFGNAQSNPSFPALTRAELIAEAQSLIDLIEEQVDDELGEHEPLLKDYERRLQHLKNYTAGQLWSHAHQTVPAYLFTLAGLRKALKPVTNRDGRAEALERLKKLTTQIRNLETRANGLEPRTADLTRMVERIEHAYNAAHQLPEDLQSLEEARRKIKSLASEAANDRGDISQIHGTALDIDKKLREHAANAAKILEDCKKAYAASTSVGLAAAFSERSRNLSISIGFWVLGLVIALAAGSYYGSTQLKNLSELFKVQNASTAVIVLNLLLSMLSIGAPVWFSWLATKQIGQRFRLAEDYAFKASISRAYEGFRQEAERFNKDMEAKLLTSALTRLDEQPLRLVETDSHGSPWHELAKSDVVKQAMKSVPGFAEGVKALATSSLEAVSAGTRQLVSKPTAASPSATTVTAQSTE